MFFFQTTSHEGLVEEKWWHPGRATGCDGVAICKDEDTGLAYILVTGSQVTAEAARDGRTIAFFEHLLPLIKEKVIKTARTAKTWFQRCVNEMYKSQHNFFLLSYGNSYIFTCAIAVSLKVKLGFKLTRGKTNKQTKNMDH